ncbi:hypothetical protein AB656_05070 [Bifidobacterium actinocoloniiforme DSM 22766]|nr:hypothetical protein AB656_05070 [Bifidobacterium actinocoloniiforme DSM 22766]
MILANLLRTLVSVVAENARCARTRVSVFEVVDGDGSPKLQPMKAMGLGRADASESVFHQEQGVGRGVWSSLLGSGILSCADTDDKCWHPNNWYVAHPRVYQPFIGVPVKAVDRAQGMRAADLPVETLWFWACGVVQHALLLDAPTAVPWVVAAGSGLTLGRLFGNPFC